MTLIRVRQWLYSQHPALVSSSTFIDQAQTSGEMQTTVITYTYDSLYRLTESVYSGNNNAAYLYSYDAVGNMTTYTEVVNGQTESATRTFNAANQLVSATGDTPAAVFIYDNNGNLSTTSGADGYFNYIYNQRNLLTLQIKMGYEESFLVAEFVYDGNNNRLQQIDHTGTQPITTTYSNDNMGMSQMLVATTHSTGSGQAATTHNLYGLDLISQQAGNGEPMRLLLPDGLGSVRQEMVGSTLQTTTTYDPYGRLLVQTGSSGTVYGFTGEQEDSATGLLYLRARYYNSNLHVFMSRDPVAGYAHRPASQNGYNYTNNNPINRTDPSGLCIPDVDGGSCHRKRNRNPNSLIDFQGAVGETWSATEKKPIDRAAWHIGIRLADTYNEYTYGFKLSSYIPIGIYDVFDCGEDKKLLRANEAFLYFYGGRAVFFKTGYVKGNYGHYRGEGHANVVDPILGIDEDGWPTPRIDVNKYNYEGVIGYRFTGDDSGYRWATHELGHFFNGRVKNITGISPYGTLASYASADTPRDERITRRGFDDKRNYGFAGEYDGWQQSTESSEGEEFADMFLGWNYDMWENDTSNAQDYRLGQARKNFMDSYMAPWIASVINQEMGNTP